MDRPRYNVASLICGKEDVVIRRAKRYTYIRLLILLIPMESVTFMSLEVSRRVEDPANGESLAEDVQAQFYR